MHAVAENPAVAKRTGISKATADKLISEDKPGKLPEHVKNANGGGLGSLRPRLQMGGLGFSSALESPWQERLAARQIFYDNPLRGGLIGSSGAGRTDTIPASVASDSHVVPADVVSGLGQGNTLAGARILSEALKVGPHGVELPSHIRGPGPPRPPSISPREIGLGTELQRGGSSEGDNDKTSVLVAGGEALINRDNWLAKDEHGNVHEYAGVRTIGDGDIEKGHRILNNMIMNVRRHNIKSQQELPPPKD